MSCHEERAIFGFVVHLAQLRKRQINCVYFLSLRESGLVKASVASPHSFPYIPAPSKNQVPGAALHFASCFVVFRRLFFCFFFLMLPDHQLSSSKRATFPFMTINLTAHLLTPAHSRAIAPPPARVCGVRQSVICGTSEPPPKSNRYIHFFGTCGGRNWSAKRILQNTRQTGRDDRERTRRARARATSVRFRGSTKGKSEGACRPLL